MNQEKNFIEKKGGYIMHYYGDQVRRLFFFAAFIIVFTYPFLSSIMPIYSIFFVIPCTLLLVLLAGTTSPLNKFVMILNIMISFFGVIFFEYNGLQFYILGAKTFSGILLFMLSHILAISFFFAFYYGLKSLRGMKLI